MSARGRWPRLGLGCASLGHPDVADAEVQAVIARALERGIRFFDVAPLYGGGLGEERLGRALSQLRRDEYVLCTKTGVTRPYGESPLAPGAKRRREHDRWDYSAQATRASVTKSLERLRVDRIDLVHLHDVESHLSVCMEAYDELKCMQREGVVGGIGIGSNWPLPVRELIDHASFDAFLLAGRYTLLDQTGRELLDCARSRGIRVIAAGVFNSGVLAAWPPRIATFDYRPADATILERTERIARIGARHGTPLAAVALQFVLGHPAVDTVLLGPRTVDELDANIDAASHPVPDALWCDLEADKIIPGDSPRATLAPIELTVGL